MEGKHHIVMVDAAINATCVRFSGVPLYASYIDCCIGHSNSTRAGPDLVVGSGCMLLVQLTQLTACTDAGPDP